MKLRTTRYPLMKKIRKSYAWSALLFYCIGVLQYSAQIKHTHSHVYSDSKVQSSELKSHPCHHCLINKDLSYASKHSTILTKPKDHCSFCDFLNHYNSYFIELKSRHNELCVHENSIHIPFSVIIYNTISWPSRAPPFHIS